jgi:flagellar biosynthesis protein FlhG
MELTPHEQAEMPRALVQKRTGGSSANGVEPDPVWTASPRVIAVASGKGGVGKTSLVANLAVAFAKTGCRVLAIDGDLGLANLDLALGVQAGPTMMDLLVGSAGIDDVLLTAAEGVAVLPACSGRYELANLGERDRHNLFAAIDKLDQRFDAVLVDTAAGIGSNAIAFAGAAQIVVVVANAEPTSLADAYAFIKVVSTRHRIKRVHVIANMVKGPSEGEDVYRRLCDLADRFLDVGLDYVGAVIRDGAVGRSVHAGVPVIIGEPRAPASHCIRSVAHKLAHLNDCEPPAGGIQLFWKRLLTWRTSR